MIPMSKNFLTLTPKATISALVMGALMLIFGRNLAIFFFFGMFWFLFISALVSFYGKKYKVSKGFFEDTRGVKNVLANGLWALIIVILYYFLYSMIPVLLIFAFMGSVAGVAADKFSSEIGVLDGEPTDLLTLKKVKKGTSGAVTLLGLAAGILASILIALLAIPLHYFLIPAINVYVLFIATVISGFGGTLFDSFLGYFEERGIGNKYTSNFFASVFGSLVAILFVL